MIGIPFDGSFEQAEKISRYVSEDNLAFEIGLSFLAKASACRDIMIVAAYDEGGEIRGVGFFDIEDFSTHMKLRNFVVKDGDKQYSPYAPIVLAAVSKARKFGVCKAVAVVAHSDDECRAALSECGFRVAVIQNRPRNPILRAIADNVGEEAFAGNERAQEQLATDRVHDMYLYLVPQDIAYERIRRVHEAKVAVARYKSGGRMSDNVPLDPAFMGE